MSHHCCRRSNHGCSGHGHLFASADCGVHTADACLSKRIYERCIGTAMVDKNSGRKVRATTVGGESRQPDPIPIAVRVYPNPTGSERARSKRAKRWRRPNAMLVFDTETTTDATQRLLFGCYRFM